MALRKVIGIHSCREALKVRSSQELKKLYLKKDWLKNKELVELAKMAERKNLKPELVSLKKLNQIGESHQGLCLVVSHQLKIRISSLPEASVVLLLDRLQDPKNLGAIIRTAWLMGVSALYISSRHSVDLSPSVAKTACGGLEYVPVEIKNSLQQCVEELKKNRFWIYALDSQAEHSFFNEKFEGRVAFLLGGESSGLRKNLKKICDKQLFLPQKEKSASYNVSVSAGIVLAEYFRQRGF